MLKMHEPLLRKQDELTFVERTHKYYWSYPDGSKKELISVTTFLHTFKEPFDAEKWSAVVAKRDDRLPEDVRAEWKRNGEDAATLGRNVHKFLETTILCGKPVVKPATHREKVVCDAALKFLDDHKDEYTILALELPIAIPEWGLAGTIDAVAKDSKGKVVILDWKTNNAIKLFNQYGGRLLSPIGHLDDCEHVVYSLQLTFYKKMLLHLKNTYGLDVAECKLVHLTQQAKGEPYFVIECLDVEAEVDALLKKVVHNDAA